MRSTAVTRRISEFEDVFRNAANADLLAATDAALEEIRPPDMAGVYVRLIIERNDGTCMAEYQWAPHERGFLFVGGLLADSMSVWQVHRFHYRATKTTLRPGNICRES